MIFVKIIKSWITFFKVLMLLLNFTVVTESETLCTLLGLLLFCKKANTIKRDNHSDMF